MYEGECKDGKMHGQGLRYNFKKAYIYNGTWVNNNQDGFGILQNIHGGRYVGNFKKNSKHGYGIYSFTDGDRYDGEWKEGRMHGQGTFFSSKTGAYNGTWVNGKQSKEENKLYNNASQGKDGGNGTLKNKVERRFIYKSTDLNYRIK